MLKVMCAPDYENKQQSGQVCCQEYTKQPSSKDNCHNNFLLFIFTLQIKLQLIDLKQTCVKYLCKGYVFNEIHS